jgi:hypothetical protein
MPGSTSRHERRNCSIGLPDTVVSLELFARPVSAVVLLLGVALQRKRAALGFVTGQKVQRKALDRPSRSNFNGKIRSEDHAESIP